MILTFLGAGSAFTYGDGNYQSNMLLTAPNGRQLLIDCGTDIRFSMGEQGLTAYDVDAVYISHCHADHIGGLEWLGFSTFFAKGCRRPVMYIEEGLSQLLWDGGLRASMSTLHNQEAELDTFFDVVRLPAGGSFEFEGARLQLVRVVHHYSGFDLMPAFGLLIQLPSLGLTYFLTTDTQFAPSQIHEFYQLADAIFQDCETSPEPTGIHAHYRELRTLTAAVKQKMWLYHYQPGPLPDAEGDRFIGFIRKGQRFDLTDLAQVRRPHTAVSGPRSGASPHRGDQPGLEGPAT